MQITTGRRLHFGLYTPIPVPALDLVYGGLGIMVDAPGVSLTAIAADSWSVTGPSSERVQALLNKAVERVPEHKPLHISVDTMAPAHQGWGTGTQLGMALATLCCERMGIKLTASRVERLQQLATMMGRGQRSSIGIAGFSQGGFLFDPGKRASTSQPVSAVRSISFPTDWTFVLVEPETEEGLHSEAERSAFSRITSVDCETVIELQRIAEQAIVPAIQGHDFESFASNLTRFNYLSGSHYRQVQHGLYATPEIEARLALMRRAGARGYGQSSWGPGLFALFPDRLTATEFMAELALPGCRMLLANVQKPLIA